ncbi:MAG: hypothetical protein JWM68_5025 [Verrucomicrobiales bacterium]|nr:hypothetical protein [Verrucomicrobiales bacterium]
MIEGRFGRLRHGNRVGFGRAAAVSNVFGCAARESEPGRMFFVGFARASERATLALGSLAEGRV